MALDLNGRKILLASKSPRRQFLLKETGIPFELVTKDVDESFPFDLKAQEIPLYLSKKKAEAFMDDADEYSIVITADTIVWINDHVLNKPANESEALDMLKEMQGKTHEVFTGVTLYSMMNEVSFFVRSEVEFHSLTDEAIKKYIAEKKPFDKAGAYGAQECLAPGFDPTSAEEKIFLNAIGKPLLIQNCIPPANVPNEFAIVKSIKGSYFNVMGLPVKETYTELGKMISAS